MVGMLVISEGLCLEDVGSLNCTEGGQYVGLLHLLPLLLPLQQGSLKTTVLGHHDVRCRHISEDPLVPSSLQI